MFAAPTPQREIVCPSVYSSVPPSWAKLAGSQLRIDSTPFTLVVVTSRSVSAPGAEMVIV